MHLTRALVVEHDPDIRRWIVQQLLRLPVAEVFEQASADGARTVLAHHQVDVVLLDLGLPDRDSASLLPQMLAADPEVRVVALVPRARAKEGIRALEAGARAYAVEPFTAEELAVLVRRAAEDRHLRRHAELARRQAGAGAALIPLPSAAWQRVVAMANDVANSARAHVLLRGEPGVGKEVVARIIHGAGARAAGPLAATRLSRTPASLMEAELFGHEGGSARPVRRGLLELASGGSLFLGDVGELPLELQPRLLRVLEGHPLRRVGGERDVAVDVRFISATHRDLDALVLTQRFRSELLSRLRVVEIHVPALRSRVEDLAPLTDELLLRAATAAGRGRVTISDEARARLAGYPWPGNVRELESVLVRATTLAVEGRIDVDHLPPEISGKASSRPRPAPPREAPTTAPWADTPPNWRLDEAVEQHVTAAWEACRHNLSRTARALGISRMALRKKLRAYGLVEASSDLPDGSGDLQESAERSPEGTMDLPEPSDGDDDREPLEAN